MPEGHDSADGEFDDPPAAPPVELRDGQARIDGAAEPDGAAESARAAPAPEHSASDAAGLDAAGLDPATLGPSGQHPEPLEAAELHGAVEAILLIVDEPVTSTVLAQVIGVPEAAVQAALEDLRDDYDRAGRGFELRTISGGWRLYTREAFASYVERFVLDGQQARLTQAALETLSVVAYRQPVSRSRVSAVRGVNVDGVMRTLVGRGLVEEAGSEHESGAVLYRTTPYFLERLGLRDLADLPNLADFLPESTTIDQLEHQLSSEGRDV